MLPYDQRMRRDWILAGMVSLCFVVGGGIYVAQSRAPATPPLSVSVAIESPAALVGSLAISDKTVRTSSPYDGYGTWVDVFDFSPPYAGTEPPVSAATVAEMAALGVQTVYLQAARLDDRSPSGLEDRWLLANFLTEAHSRDIEVVAWYLPRFANSSSDLDRVLQMAEFSVLGQRFDGVAVDIEWTGDGIDHETRSERLIALSAGITAALPDDAIGGIVITPVQLEVVNPDFWPGFPWAEIAENYDVWLPMAYWSFRSTSSGYGDGYAYLEESVRRLRTNIGDADALVHGIGGIGGVDGVDDPVDPPEPLATLGEIERFVDALDVSGAVGGSMYDWVTLEPAARTRLQELFASS